MSDLYASKGETATCPEGHYIATISRDLHSGDKASPDCFERVRSEIEGKFATGEVIPECPDCGRQWIGKHLWFGGFHMYVNGAFK